MADDPAGYPNLEELIDQLLVEDPKLAASLIRVGITSEQLLESAQSGKQQITMSTTSESEALSIATAQLKRVQDKAVQPRELHVPLGNSHPGYLVLVLSIGILLFAISYSLPATVAVYLRVGSAVLVTGSMALASAVFISRWANRRFQENADARNSTLGVDASFETVAVARQNLIKAQIDRGLRPIAILMQQERGQPPYSTTLKYITARGLSEVYDPVSFEVETPSFLQVRALLDRTSGGSLGLAGQRGTGKTTVMSSFVEGRSRRSDGKRGRAVRVSAPVDYVARDFILYLFSELCQAILLPRPLWERPTFRSQHLERTFRSITREYRTIILVVSQLLLLAGVGLMLFSRYRSTFSRLKLTVDWFLWSGFLLTVVSACLLLITQLQSQNAGYRRRGIRGIRRT